MALTAKQKLFVEAYLANGYRAVPAYLSVYTGGKESSAKANAYRLLGNPEIKQMIQEEQRMRYNALNISADRIAEELCEMAFAEKGDKDYTANVKLKAIDLLQSQLGLKRNKLSVDGDVDTRVTIVEDI